VTVVAYIGFGSNEGDRRVMFEHALQAIDALTQTKVLEHSGLYETEPVGLSDGGGRFLNAVIAVETDLDPSALFQALRQVERTLGKSPDHRSDRSRSVDLDLLLYGTDQVHEEGLIVPHPRMHDRAFVLVPLAEVAASVVVPDAGRTVSDLRNALPNEACSGMIRISGEIPKVRSGAC
jgi:2-amino-4-hydroxy-6-hydroxymethyldihydropteridine diphosphokinase